jgi:hypothetical protein
MATRPFPGADGGSSATLSIASPPQGKSPVKLAMRTCQSSLRNVAAFIKEFETMTARSPNFTFIPTVTRHTNAELYEKGPINRQMLKRHLVWPKGPIYGDKRVADFSRRQR